VILLYISLLCVLSSYAICSHRHRFDDEVMFRSTVIFLVVFYLALITLLFSSSEHASLSIVVNTDVQPCYHAVFPLPFLLYTSPISCVLVQGIQEYDVSMTNRLLT